MKESAIYLDFFLQTKNLKELLFYGQHLSLVNVSTCFKDRSGVIQVVEAVEGSPSAALIGVLSVRSRGRVFEDRTIFCRHANSPAEFFE